MTGDQVSQLPPGYVNYAEAYPPELRYLYQPAPMPKRHTRLKVGLAVAAVLVLLGGLLGYLYARPYLVEFPATLTTPDSVAGMPRLTDDRSLSIGDEMTAYIRDQTHVDSSMAALYAPDGVPDQAVLVYAGTHFVSNPGGAVNDVFTGFSRSSGLTVTNMASTGPGAMGGTAKCGQTRTADVPIALCVWGDHGSVGVVIGFGRTIPETADLLRTIRPQVLHR
jgi:hypothetical protein